MILTEKVLYRGKMIPLSKLKPNTLMKVKVLCPSCGSIREAYYKAITRANNDMCHKCTLKARSKQLPHGSIFGKLTVIQKSDQNGYPVCKCACGNIKEVSNYGLTSGGTKSCGCLKKESFKNIKRLSGEQHGNWKGGISKERDRFYTSAEAKEWKRTILQWDNYTCQKCGQVGKKLNVHHIFNYADYKGKRLEFGNGIVLCENCHKQFHRQYGRHFNNSEQLTKYLKVA